MRDAGEKVGLFDSVLQAPARRAETRARVLKLLPLVIALHVLALLGAAAAHRSSSRKVALASDGVDAPVLRLMVAPPPPPPLGTSTAAPVPRKKVVRRFPLHPKPLPVPPEPDPAPAEEPPPAEAEDAEDSDVATAAGGPAGGSPDGVQEGVVGGVVGGVVQGALAGANLQSVMAPPPHLTPEEREAWLQRYLETLIRGRFMNVRYPHQASAAGITGRVVLRVGINARGRLLSMELLGQCPHPVLCDAAMEVVRKAAPFPPPPKELGSSFFLELPFNYHLR